MIVRMTVFHVIRGAVFGNIIARQNSTSVLLNELLLLLIINIFSTSVMNKLES